MIYKEIDPKNSKNHLEKAGTNAEKQMAFYLKRAFSDEKKVFVLNDVRVIVDDEVAQIDHLIVHSFGFIVIESKSVTTEVCINEYDEWSRVFNGQKKGMPSPIKQAERQIEILKKLLDNNASSIFKENIFNKLTKPKFSSYKFDVIVAISDDGMIERQNKNQSEQIVKAEQVVEKINGIFKNYNRQNIINPLFVVPMQTTLIERTSKFIKENHQPISSQILQEEKSNEKKIETRESVEPKAIQSMRELSFTQKVTTDEKNPICSKCQSPNIEIHYGKYGYYFKCLFCKGNTAIKLTCRDKNCKPKLRKRKLEFTQVCSVCGDEKLFFTNKERLAEVE